MDDDFVGRHLLLDFTVSSPRNIIHIEPIYDFMEEMSCRLDMTLIHPPIVAKLPFANSELQRFVKTLKDNGVVSDSVVQMEQLLHARANKESGVSGISMWLESHCSIHTWPEKSFVSLDAYSCHDFDITIALDLVKEMFDVEEGRGLDVVRHIHSPQKTTQIIMSTIDS